MPSPSVHSIAVRRRLSANEPDRFPFGPRASKCLTPAKRSPVSDTLTPDVVDRLVSALHATTPDWYPDSRVAVRNYMLNRWHSKLAAEHGVDAVITTWTGSGRPPLGVLQTAYNSACARLGIAEQNRKDSTCLLCDGTGFVSYWDISPVSGQMTSYAKRCSHPADMQSATPDRIVPPSEGWAIAEAAYEAAYGRPMNREARRAAKKFAGNT